MKIQLKRSNVLEGGSAKQPSAAQMEYGELAVNYNTDDPALFIKDSDDDIIRIAGVGAVGNYWDRTDTTLSPVNSGDDVEIGSGNISLNANGNIQNSGITNSGYFYSTNTNPNWESIQLFTDTTKTFRAHASGTVHIGGDLTAQPGSPNITLNADGSAEFAEDVTVHDLTVGRGGNEVISNTAVGVDALQANTSGSDNTANGYQALFSNTEGVNNTATGGAALYSNTTGIANTAAGYEALYNNISGAKNTAIGSRALFSNTEGVQNTATGNAALYSNTTGINNTAAGRAALYSNTTGINNTATGNTTLRFSTTGDNNVANGYAALFSNTTGDNNTATGYQALYSNTTGINNTANGYAALGGSSRTDAVDIVAGTAYVIATVGTTDFTAIGAADNDVGTLFVATGPGTGTGTARTRNTGDNNTATGYQALQANTTGRDNTADGYLALYTNATGSNGTAIGTASQRNANDTTTPFLNTNVSVGYGSLRGSDIPANNTGLGNTVVGYEAMMINTSGSFNTANGYQALYSNTTGNANICIGYEAGSAITTGSNNTIIGQVDGSDNLQDTVIIAAGTTERLRIDENDIATFTGKVTSTSTELSDAATTLTTKDYVDSVAGSSGNTNISITHAATTATVNSSTGSSGQIDAATTSLAGVMTGADKTKLDGIATGAEVNTVDSVAGKTGAVTLVKGDVGLENVDNTSDLDKPISTATQTALDGKATSAQGDLADSAVQPGDDVSFNDIDVTGRYVSGVTAVSALDIDCSSGNYFTKTINANSTFTFSNVPADKAYSFTLELAHTSGTVTWPASVMFPDDTAPTLTTGKTHLFMFVTDDGGARFRGTALVNYVN